MTPNNDANSDKFRPMTDMYCPDDTDDMMMDIEADQRQIEEERQMAIESTVGLEPLQWFEGTGGQTRMFANATLKNHQVHIAADVYMPSTHKTVKKYATLPRHTDLVRILYDCFENDKPCLLYELINRDAPCRIHVDSEWVEKEFSGHSRITALVELLTVYLKETYGFDPVIVVSNSSRQKAGQWKQSWHFTVTNASFSSNKGEMQSFMRRFQVHHQDTEILWVDGAFLVDMTVYTNYRVIRTPLSYKEDDPLKTKMLPCQYNGTEWVTQPIMDEEQLLDYLITYLPDGVMLLPDSEPCTNSNSQRHASGVSRRQNPRPAPLEQNSAQEATILAQVQGMVHTEGGSGCVVYNIQQTFDDGTMRIRCKNDGPRKCLVTKDEIHENDNAFITVYPDGRVMYNCYSNPCRDYEPGVQIGKLQPFDESLYMAVSHLALMGPAATFEDAREVIETAARAAGGRITAQGVRDLEDAAAEWLHRLSTLTVQNKLDLIGKLKPTDGPFGCEKDALSALWSRRKEQCAIRFKTGAELVKSPDLELSPVFFLRNVDLQSTHVYSLVLCTRLRWPDARDIVYDYVRFNCSKEQACTLADIASFDKVWATEHDLALGGAFVSSINRYIGIDLESHPFVSRVIAKKMGNSVFRYEKGEHDLRFSLDDGTAISSKLPYRFDYYTGEIRKEGGGVMHRFFSMKRFFSENGGAKLMGEMLPEIGIGEKMRFDSKVKDWKIFDPENGIWRPPLSDFEPQGIVGSLIEEQLDPLCELESLLGAPFDSRFNWVDSEADSASTRNDADDDADVENDNADVENDSTKRKKRAGDDDTASKKQKSGDEGSENNSKKSTMRVVGGKAWRSKISAAKFSFGQILREQTEVLKTLQHHVRFDFFKEQEKIKHLLCCPNGVVDLRTGELLGKPTPDQCFTQLCATKYDPDADTRPAIDFFGHAFPVEAYPDSTDLVVYMQQFGGYSLTLETNLQSCLFVYGKGSNAKSIWMRMFADVWGKPMQCTIPIESLSKARGTNNDSLTDAMQSRLVVLSESNGKAKIDIGTFNALVCGEETTCKKMYKTETNYDPRMKFISMLNDPPDFPPGAFHIERRCGYMPLNKIYYDYDKAHDQQLIQEHRARGGHECLIAEKDLLYYENHVVGKEESFLRFFVEGAMGYYNAGQKIRIPTTMQRQAKSEAFDQPAAIEEFVSERLAFTWDEKELLIDMYDAFLTMFEGDVNALSLSYVKFCTYLGKNIENRHGEWDLVKKANSRKGGRAGTVYKNIKMTTPILPVVTGS